LADPNGRLRFAASCGAARPRTKTLYVSVDDELSTISRNKVKLFLRAAMSAERRAMRPKGCPEFFTR
jgi:hypothetical protein